MLYLPFKLEAVLESKEADTNSKQTEQKLSESLRKKCEQNQHLLLYVQTLNKNGLTIPEYADKLNRGMRSVKNRNIIYPVGDGIFVHILANLEDIRDHYIPVEPSFGMELDLLLDEIEVRLAEYVEELEGITDETKRAEIVQKIVDRMVSIRDGALPRAKKNGNSGNGHSGNGNSNVNGNHANGNGNGGKSHGSMWRLLGNGKSKNKIVLTRAQYQGLQYLLKCKLEGLGVLEPMIRDNYIEDISCSGLGNIFVEHKIFGGVKTAIGFGAHLELDKFVIQLAERVKHPVTFRNPCVDATLPDGSRVNIVYGTDVSKRGSNFTIRKFSPVPMSIIEVIESGGLNYEMAAYLSLIIQEHMNIFVSGETASGKTTLLNALALFIPPENKIVSIEDTPELQVPHPNWIRGVTRESTKSSESTNVTMFDLLKAALRQRPNIIIVGEIRGAEGAIAFQAMQTGHACMSTFHASSVTKLIQRLTGNPICVPKSYVDNLNVVITCQAVRLPDGRTGRRITSINEIISYDSVTDTFSFIEVFVWDPVNDTFIFRGDQNSYLMEYKIAPKRGLSHDRRREIYQQIKQRAKILQRLKEQGIAGFYDLYAFLSKAYRDGHFK